MRRGDLITVFQQSFAREPPRGVQLPSKLPTFLESRGIFVQIFLEVSLREHGAWEAANRGDKGRD